MKARNLEGQDLLEVFEFIHRTANNALKNSRELLPVLNETGVVDAGGQGLVYLFEGMLRAARFEAIEKQTIDEAHIEGIPESLELIGKRYCMELIVELSRRDTDKIRTELEKMGNSIVTAIMDNLLKVHIHTDCPDEVREYLFKYGKVVQEKIDDTHKPNRKFYFTDDFPAIVKKENKLRTVFSCVN
jgi:dihydroxyacetone kinase-like predicted kinase